MNESAKPETNELKQALADNFQILAEKLDRYLELNHEINQSQLRCDEAISNFMARLDAFLYEKEIPDLNRKEKGYVINASGYTKTEVITLIRSLRKHGATFDEIAKTLMEKGIPTFSGRGDWHAQTIHRLCK